jgi:1-acyl-sn-glycerol-3-phosphate acyltransferase
LSDHSVSKYNGAHANSYPNKSCFPGSFSALFCTSTGVYYCLPFFARHETQNCGTSLGFFGRSVVKLACHAKIAILEDHRGQEFRGTPCYGLYVANHQSYVDIPLMVTLFQAPPIMKKEVLYIPIFGWMAWISGALPVSRGKTSSRRKVFEKAKKRIMKERIGLQVYPEGTRSKDALPKAYSEIKRTLLVFAFNEQIPVVPVSIYGTRGVLSSKGFINSGRNIGMIVHQEIYPEKFPSADEFAEACWNKVREGHDRMKSQLGPLNESLSLA